MLYDNNWYKNVQDCSFFRHIPACGLVRKITKRLCRRVEETYSLNGSLQSNKIFCRRTATRITLTRCFPHETEKSPTGISTKIELIPQQSSLTNLTVRDCLADTQGWRKSQKTEQSIKNRAFCHHCYCNLLIVFGL